MKTHRPSSIPFVLAMVAAAGVAVVSPACGSSSTGSDPGVVGGVATGGASSALGLGGSAMSTLGGAAITSTGGSSSQSLGGTSSGTVAGSSSICTSKIVWTGSENANMRPGEACITCHSVNPGAPVFTIAGTVYPTAHEPADCNGSNASGAATVVITDAQGLEHTIPVNAAGNFTLQSAIPVPFHARVVVGSATRSMVSAQTIGDCNSCHTVTGTNAAPGRIMLP